MDSAAPDIARELDPFGFLVDYRSAITPLGGKEHSPDPRYVFHTPYVEFRPGRVLFTVRFEGLRATFGELRVNINAFIPGSGRDAIFVTSARLHLADATAVERGLAISFMTVAGASYAAYGYCTEGTDARATGLSLRAEQLEASDEATAQQPLLPTSLGATDLLAATRLVTDEPASFANPVSQAMTPAQTEEADFRKWASRLAPRPATSAEQWRLAFIAQALDRYGMLRAGARGIGWGEESRSLAPIFASAQCEALLATIPEGAGEAAIAWNAFNCSALDATPGPDGSLPGLVVSLAEQPADRRGFDFLWTIGAAEQGYAAGSSADLLIERMGVLRPAGYAVHMFDMAATGDDPRGVPRSDVERLAVTLIARGFSVVQLNFDNGGEAAGLSPFGLIVRKD